MLKMLFSFSRLRFAKIKDLISDVSHLPVQTKIWSSDFRTETPIAGLGTRIWSSDSGSKIWSSDKSEETGAGWSSKTGFLSAGWNSVANSIASSMESFWRIMYRQYGIISHSVGASVLTCFLLDDCMHYVWRVYSQCWILLTWAYRCSLRICCWMYWSMSAWRVHFEGFPERGNSLTGRCCLFIHFWDAGYLFLTG